MKKTEVFEYKKGEELHLDQIYTIQGLCGGDWWERVTDDELSDYLVVTRDIKIKIIEE